MIRPDHLNARTMHSHSSYPPLPQVFGALPRGEPALRGLPLQLSAALCFRSARSDHKHGFLQP
jgi:hypothetical protein